MHKYLKQLTQISVLNFFFIFGLLYFIQKSTQTPLQNNIPQKTPSSFMMTSPTTMPPKNTQISPTSLSNTNPKNIFTEISLHNKKSDCWLKVGGHIYDITTYFGSHPGGDGPIQKYCGTDATIPFTTKDGIGSDHSASAYDLLRQYLIQ